MHRDFDNSLRLPGKKVVTAKPGGGCIYQSDHSVPPTVSFDSYRFWMDLARERGGYG